MQNPKVPLLLVYIRNHLKLNPSGNGLFSAKISINGIQATQDMAYFIQIGQNIVHFQRNSRVPHNSWKIPGMMEFWNYIQNQVLSLELSRKNTLYFEIVKK